MMDGYNVPRLGCAVWLGVWDSISHGFGDRRRSARQGHIGTAKLAAASSSMRLDATTASITFPEPMVEPEPEPVPALPLIAQWLLGLGLMGGGARQLFRRRRQG